MTRPSITAQTLISELMTDEGLTEQQLVSVLGDAFTKNDLYAVQKRLLDSNMVSEERLRLVVQAITGMEVLPLDASLFSDTLPTGAARTIWGDQAEKERGEHRILKNMANTLGVLFVDRDTPTVAVIEDLPETIKWVANYLGTENFDVVLMLGPHFTALYHGVFEGKSLKEVVKTPDIYKLLDMAISQDSSDIHLSVGQPPVFRTHGAITRSHFQAVDREWMRQAVLDMTTEENLRIAEKIWQVDFAYSYGSTRFRVSVGANTNGLTIAARRLPSKLPTVKDLNLPPSMVALTEAERGLVLVTGPTGSGKTTTLAALLGEVVRFQRRHVITLEDPVEYKLPTDGKSLVDQRELGHSFTTFADGLRQALRQDPDVILVGELRDAETIKTALLAAETGHLVFATTHTSSSESTLGRLTSVYAPEEQEGVRAQLSHSLRGIISQTLLPKAVGKGRVGAFEILINTDAIAANLKRADGMPFIKQTMETAHVDGMQTMDQALARLVVSGMVSEAEAEFRCRNREAFRNYVTTF